MGWFVRLGGGIARLREKQVVHVDWRLLDDNGTLGQARHGGCPQSPDAVAPVRLSVAEEHLASIIQVTTQGP